MRLAVAVIVLMGALASSAAATPGAGPPNSRVSGPYAGTQSFEFTSEVCPAIHQVFRGAYETSRGRTGGFRLDGCVVFGSSGIRYDGDFRVTTPGGARLRGTVTGTTGRGAPAALDLTLTLTEGTKRLEGASGTIALSGVWSNEPPDSFGQGPTSGSLTGALTGQP